MVQLTFKLLLQALDQGSAPTRKYRGEVKKLTDEVKKGPASWIATAAATDKAERSSRRYVSAATSTRMSVEHIADAQARLRRETDRTESSLGRMFRRLGAGASSAGGRWMSSLGRGVAGLGVQAASWGGMAAGATVGGAMMFGKGVIGTGAQFERYQTQLKTMHEGDALKARDSMSWVMKFAETTPYEIDEVVKAFIKLQAYGIDPADGSLRTLGDTASAMDKQVLDAVEALADAQNGEFERLKEFNVKARQQGERISFTYTKAGKDVTVTARKSAAEIRKALLGIFDSRFAGSMAAQSKTFDGMMSNLKDRWTLFKLGVSDGGVFDFAKGELQELLTKLDEAAASGKLQEWTNQTAASLKEMFVNLSRLAKEVDWVGLTNAAIGFAGAVVNVASALTRYAEAQEALHKSKFGFARVIPGIGAVMDAGAGVGGIVRPSPRPQMATPAAARAAPPAKVQLQIDIDQKGRAVVRSVQGDTDKVTVDARRGMVYGSD